MGRSERTPQDPPLDAAIRYLLKEEKPSDLMLGTFEDGEFKPATRQRIDRPVESVSPVRRLLRAARLTNST